MAIFGHARFSQELRCRLPSEGPQVIDCDARVPPPSTAAASIDRDARVPPPSTAAASTDELTAPGTHRQIAQALPGNLGKLNRAKRDSERRKNPRGKAAFAVRTSSSAYKAAKKSGIQKVGQLLNLRQLQQDEDLLLRTRQHIKYRATAKAKTAAARRTYSAAYKAAKKISDSKRRATAKTKAAKQ